MRHLPALLAFAALTLSGAARAQSLEYPIEIEDVRVGLPPGRFGAERDATTQKSVHVVKRGTWAPVYLDILLKKELAGGAKLKIEASDADELKTTLYVPLTNSFNGLLPGVRLKSAEFGYTPYVRAGDRGGDCRVSVLSNDGKDTLLARPFQVRNLLFREASNYVVLSLGTRLPGFDLPGDRTPNASARSALRNGRVEAAAITSVADMPDQWFGYQAADLVVLTTGGDAQFLKDLFSDSAPPANRLRREALLEWVRRGGKLVVSVGVNAQLVVQYRQFEAILPAPLRADPALKTVTTLPIYATLPGSTINDNLVSKAPGGGFPVANFAANPRRAARQLLPPPEDGKPDPEATPTVLQAAYGLGRVTAVAFDLDQSPFLDYANRAQFWDWLVREAGASKSALAPPTGNGNGNTWSNTSDNEDEWAAAIRRHVDTFDGVPVVSFGWVALFIILYTLLIGPVEYLVLKYVFKRLELTWITFPLIVVTVSAAAYFTAYSIKGNDLKINKVDVVDVDLQGGRVYGKSWFTVFSPRIDRYTVGVEPREGWTASVPGTPDPAPLVGWMAGGSGGSGSLVSSGYDYSADPDGKAVSAGLDRVPIQVWSTKAFTANWSGAVDPGTPPVVADLFHPPGNPKALTGSFVSNLPVETLRDPLLIYAGKVFKLPAIQPGQKVDVPAAGLPEDTSWLSTAAGVNLAPNTPSNNSRFGGSSPPAGGVAITNLNIWGALFHEKATGSGKALSNASLRDLDQSWRVEEAAKAKYFDEAILVASLAPPSGPTEAMMTDPTGPSPTKLWLRGGLPGGKTAREPVPGTMRQETYIRVYIPIRPTAKK